MIIFTEMNRNNYHTINNEKRINKYRNFILHDSYSNCEYNKFKDYYISYYYRYELISIGYFNYLEEYHRNNGPALIRYYTNGQINYKKYYLNDKKYSYEDYILEIKKLV